MLKSTSDTIKELQDTIKKLLEPCPFYRLTTFWLSVGFIILFVALCGIGYLYLTETKAEYDSSCISLVDQVKDIKANNQILIKQYQDIISELRKEGVNLRNILHENNNIRIV